MQRLRLGFIARDVPSIGYRAYYLDAQPGDLPAGLTRLEATLPGDYTWENDALRVRITRGGLVECFEKRRRRTLLAADHYLGFEVVEMGSPGHDVGEGERDITAFDWRAVRPFQPRAHGLERTAERGSGLTLLEDGPLRTRVNTVSDFSHGTVRQTFTLYRDLDRVDVAVDIVSWKGIHGREFRLLFPLGMIEACISYDVPFGYIRVGQDELDGFAHMRPQEVQSWLHAGGDNLDVTLSSSVVAHDWVDPLGWTNRPVLQAVLLATKRSCHPKGPWYTQEGNHSFWASITGGVHSLEERTRFGGAHQRPLEAIVPGRSAHSSATAVPPIRSFLSVEPANVVVTSFKRSEAGDGLIVRCCEIAGRDTEAAIQMSTPVRSVSRSNLLEDEEAVFWSGAQPTHQVSIPMSAFGIATVKLRQ